MNEDGISLLEVIITTVIIGLLTSVAALSINHYLMLGKTKVVNADLITLSTAVRLYLKDNRRIPVSFNPATDLVPKYLPELPVDPFSSNENTGYTIEVREDPADGIPKVYIGSCGPDGVVDYGESGSKDDIYKYVK